MDVRCNVAQFAVGRWDISRCEMGYDVCGPLWVGLGPVARLWKGWGRCGWDRCHHCQHWMVGCTGVEWAFAPNWTVKLEYDFLGLNSLPVIPTTVPANVLANSS